MLTLDPGGSVLENRATFAAVWALLLCGSSLADFTWDGGPGVGDLMTTDGNWAGGAAPDLDVAGDNLIFGVPRP